MPSTQTDLIDGVSTSVAMKATCRIYATVNLTLSGLQTVNGYAVQEGDRVFAPVQTDQTQSGIWIASSASWTRAPDWDGARDVAFGTIVPALGPDGIVLFQVTTLNAVIGSALVFETVGLTGGSTPQRVFTYTASHIFDPNAEDEAIIVINSASATNLTLPQIALVGAQGGLMQYGSGSVTVVSQSGLLRNYPGVYSTVGLYATAYFHCIANSDGQSAEWALSGQLA